jgi:glyoxalase/bleomycin resistance protein/dioxygenase superfamily protein
MKRLHVHVAVEDLGQSTRFYSTLFAAEPTVVKDDYVKWMLEDPRVNFAISARPGRSPGISHLGIQAEDQAELAEVYDRLARAERPIVEARAAICCYARSDKQWIADPQGVPWETFFTYGESTVYGEGSLLARRRAASRKQSGRSYRRRQLRTRAARASGPDRSRAWTTYRSRK